MTSLATCLPFARPAELSNSSSSSSSSASVSVLPDQQSCFFYDLVPTPGSFIYFFRFEEVIGNGRILVGVAPSSAARGPADVYKHPLSSVVYANNKGQEPAGWWNGTKQTAPLWGEETRRGGGWQRGERCAMHIYSKLVDTIYFFVMEFAYEGAKKWEKVREWSLNEPLSVVVGIVDPGTSVTCCRAR